jgi:hypothetical protein
MPVWFSVGARAMFDLIVRGVGFWSPGVDSWAHARELVRTRGSWPEASAGRATPSLMPANERRRAPDSVLLALAVAEQACTDAGVDPTYTPSVFVSVYGDLVINDYMCATLTEASPMLSPTKFHNSVHNAPSGYWSIATGARTQTTSIAGFRETFAAGLLESAMQLAEGGGPVLLVAYDVAGAGPMAEVACCTMPFGCALVLDSAGDAPPEGEIAGVRMDIVKSGGVPDRSGIPSLDALAAANPIADGCVALLQALATSSARRIVLKLSPSLDLSLQTQP